MSTTFLPPRARRVHDSEARGSRARGFLKWLDSDRVEPWRDALAMGGINHALLLTIALVRPHGLWFALSAVPLAVSLAAATLTVVHDAGHRRFARSAWPNMLAVQFAVPIGFWMAHWTLKHRVHHKVTQVYPLDDATRSSGMVRLHPSAPRWKVHQWQHIYAWSFYGLAWVGELRSQVKFLRTGQLAGIETPGPAERTATFATEKLICGLFLLPYALLMGVGHLAVLLVISMTLASLLAAIVLVVGHINIGLQPTDKAPKGPEWSTHLVRTTASFNTTNPAVRWITGGMTHHLAHHLRPVAPRSQFDELHATVVEDVVRRAGIGQIEYRTLTAAVVGHYRKLKDLGRPDAEVDVGAPEYERRRTAPSAAT